MSMNIWELPDVLLYHVIRYVAPETHRASVLCHQIAPLCQASRKVILEDDRCTVSLWDTVLKEEYGVVTTTTNENFAKSRRRRDSAPPQRRSCKRLKRRPVEKVRDAHILMKDHTEIAYYYLSEMAHASSRDALSKRKLCSLLEEYGPHLRINHTVSSGGTYLVEVCRARNVSERIILQCVQELVTNRGARLDLATFEAQNSNLTAICIAATRGMPSVVKFLLRQGAAIDRKCSGRFRLQTNSKKSIRCNNSTPLEFAQAMRNAELAAGANDQNMRELNKCISMLEKHNNTI